MAELVLVEKKGAAAIVTLNRPEKMNALSRALMVELTTAMKALQRDDSITAVIVTGAGNAFCAGLDLQELSSDGGLDNFALTDDYDMESAFLDFEKPIIGAINGVAATGGFELALWCDILIASDKAKFADTHARVGILPGWGLSQRLSRLIGINRARELSFTGNFLSAEKAEAWGLVNRLVSEEELLPVSEQLICDMASCVRETLVRYKRVINQGYKMNLSSALDFESMTGDLHVEMQTAEAIAARKDKVIGRGKSQT